MFGLKSKSLFSQSKELERQIDEFVNTVSEVGLIFKKAIRDYLSNGSGNNFDKLFSGFPSLVYFCEYDFFWSGIQST